MMDGGFLFSSPLRELRVRTTVAVDAQPVDSLCISKKMRTCPLPWELNEKAALDFILA